MLQECRTNLLLPTAFVDLNGEQIYQSLLREHALVAATLQYTIQPIPIPVHLFVAQENEVSDPALGWNSIIQPHLLRVISVAGNHRSMLNQIGGPLCDALARARLEAATIPESDYSPLVTLRNSPGDGMKCFCVPEAGGNASAFLELMDHLEPSWSVYVLQPGG